MKEKDDIGVKSGLLGGFFGSQLSGMGWILRGVSSTPSCPICHRILLKEEQIYRCGCNRILHGQCLEETDGTCGDPQCKILEREPHQATLAEAISWNRNDVGNSQRTLGLIFGVPFGLLFIASLFLAPQFKILLISGLGTFFCGFGFLFGTYLRRSTSDNR